MSYDGLSTMGWVLKQILCVMVFWLCALAAKGQAQFCSGTILRESFAHRFMAPIQAMPSCHYPANHLKTVDFLREAQFTMARSFPEQDTRLRCLPDRQALPRMH